MSVINNANPGSHIASLIFIDRLLNRKIKNGKAEPVLLEDILDKYRPDYLFKDDKKDENGEFKFQDNPHKKLKDSLNFWCSLGLWQTNDDKIFAKDVNASELNFPSRLCECIFSKRVDIIDGNGVEPLIRFIALFLSLERYTHVGQQHFKQADISSIISKFLTSKTKNLTSLSLNSTNSVFHGYGLLLGFFEKVDKNHYTVDPTRLYEPFIRRVLLESALKDGMLINDFLKI